MGLEGTLDLHVMLKPGPIAGQFPDAESEVGLPPSLREEGEYRPMEKAPEPLEAREGDEYLVLLSEEEMHQFARAFPSLPPPVQEFLWDVLPEAIGLDETSRLRTMVNPGPSSRP